MSGWNNWYNSFLETKRNNEFQAFAAGLRGEKYEPPIIKPKIDSTSSWSELIAILQANPSDYGSLDYNLKEGKIQSNNPMVLICIDKALKANANYGINRILHYLIFNYLRTYMLKSMADFIKVIREIPEEIFIECNNCGKINEPGWMTCSKCQIDIENSFDE